MRFLITAAAVLYAVGGAVTGAGNVPLNDALAGYTDPTPAVATHARADFGTDWNRYNLMAAESLAAVALADGHEEHRGWLCGVPVAI